MPARDGTLNLHPFRCVGVYKCVRASGPTGLLKSVGSIHAQKMVVGNIGRSRLRCYANDRQCASRREAYPQMSNPLMKYAPYFLLLNSTFTRGMSMMRIG